ncbi:Putative negative regulator of RcsB-dependent stress response [Alkalispirochaeta americana]|uniref:Putative negative regulator of RcsB-dependent stress response n=1 Tax=Alkalispirochaeta americana TaxID=159291 RepID=A0A1N6RAY2_9SPIO|nr:tetratricopeptide repeat protein [Alkalispirochaeta americana]SIQ25983.1 Putative negative regulator of RcsB-dependent stress response [Alkalispirochaeta americana]
MFFTQEQISSLLTGVSATARDRELEETLTNLSPRLAAKRNEYRHFGPYWWWVKPLVKRFPGARKSWLRGCYQDTSFLDSVDAVSPLLPSLEEKEAGRWLAWLGLRYYEAEIVDETPASLHIVERANKTVIAYRIYDADASEQMDLFGENTDSKEELEQFLADPVRFSGSAWLKRADAYIEEGDLLRSSAALRRAVDRAIDEKDRSTAWIRLGQVFQEHHHTRKAIFCFHNAWERDREGWIQGLIAEAYMEDNQTHQALSCYEAALQAMPGNPEYQAGVERCRRLIREQPQGFSLDPDHQDTNQIGQNQAAP